LPAWSAPLRPAEERCFFNHGRVQVLIVRIICALFGRCAHINAGKRPCDLAPPDDWEAAYFHAAVPGERDCTGWKMTEALCCARYWIACQDH